MINFLIGFIVGAIVGFILLAIVKVGGIDE